MWGFIDEDEPLELYMMDVKKKEDIDKVRGKGEKEEGERGENLFGGCFFLSLTKASPTLSLPIPGECVKR